MSLSLRFLLHMIFFHSSTLKELSFLSKIIVRIVIVVVVGIGVEIIILLSTLFFQVYHVRDTVNLLTNLKYFPICRASFRPSFFEMTSPKSHCF